MRVFLNLVLFLALLAVIAANFVLRPNPARPNYDVLPDMARAARYNAFAANPNFANGETLQAPPAGTIPRGLAPLHYSSTPQDALRAADELHSPMDLNSQQSRQRGAYVFTNYCAVCHGPGGAGNGSVTQRGFPPPPSLLADRARNMKDGQLFHILTFGQNNMPSYASQLSRLDRWAAIARLRQLQFQASPQVLSSRASASARVEGPLPAQGSSSHPNVVLSEGARP